MNVLIMGRPGAGKGTQAVNIKKNFNIPHISSGDMFREAVSKQTALGTLAKSYMDKGQLVPDEVTIGIIKERLASDDCKKGFLLDGFPRTIEQAKALDNILNELNMNIDIVLDVVVDIDLLVKRMVGRRVCRGCGMTFHTEFAKSKIEGICDSCSGQLYQRADDTKETAFSRLEVYDKQTAPLLEYYNSKQILKVVNGQQNTEKVFDDIKDILGNLE